MPIQGAAADRTLAPVYPGITESATLGGLGSAVSRSTCGACAAIDEDYWKQYRTTPKAFIAARSRAAAVALALRRSDVGPRRAAAGQSLADARDRYAARLRARHRSARGGLVGDGRARRRAGGVPRRDRLRRVLHLFQFLPRRLGAAARRRCSSGSASSSARARSGCFAPSDITTGAHPPAVCRRGARADGARQRDRRCGRDRLRVRHDGRSGLMVERRRRHRARSGSTSRRRRSPPAPSA